MKRRHRIVAYTKKKLRKFSISSLSPAHNIFHPRCSKMSSKTNHQSTWILNNHISEQEIIYTTYLPIKAPTMNLQCFVEEIWVDRFAFHNILCLQEKNGVKKHLDSAPQNVNGHHKRCASYWEQVRLSTSRPLHSPDNSFPFSSKMAGSTPKNGKLAEPPRFRGF